MAHKVRWATTRSSAQRTGAGGLDRRSDEVLFQAYVDGDQDAFRALVQRYQEPIRGFIHKRINDEERVQDLTQDTFFRLHRARNSYDPGRKFSTWLYTIANNLVKNEYRNRSRSRIHSFSELRPERNGNGDASLPLEFEAPGPDPEHNAYRGELREAIQTAISRMDEHHRLPFVMREIDDYAYEEIAQRLGIPEGTVKSRLFRARNAFKDQLPIPL